MSDEKDEMVVTPYEVRGTIDYDRLIKEFGTQRIDEKLKAMDLNMYQVRRY